MSQMQELQAAVSRSQIDARSAAWERARRPKAQLSCVTCRIRKQKCDRNRPCQNCSKRNPHECVYVDGHSPGRHLGISNQKRRLDSPLVVSDQLNSFESQSARLADKTSRVQDEDRDSFSTPHLRAGIPASQEKYSNERIDAQPRSSIEQSGWQTNSLSHWESILDDLEEIKHEASQCNSTAESELEANLFKPADLAGPQLLFGGQDGTTKAELLSYLPTKNVVYQLLSVFLQQDGIPMLAPVVLHAPTFLKECEQFWTDPLQVHLAWLSILYSILSISLQSLLRADQTIGGILHPQLSCSMFTAKSALCLRMSDYAKPTKYTVEAMILNLASEHFWIEREPFRASLGFSMIVRTAQRMGYHREPSHSPQKSVLEAEMQRRIWTLIKQLDMFLAGKCALPRFINNEQSDTAPPANLLDEDLSEEMTELPASRPHAQRTTVGYLNYKMRLLTVHGRILDLLHGSSGISYEQTLCLDGELMAQVNTRPAWLDPPTAQETEQRPLVQLGPLIDADMIVQRARMILHYKYAIAGHHDPTFWTSRKVGSNAAEIALMYHRILYDAAERSGGIKRHWRLLSQLAHDFLLAVMVLGLSIDQEFRSRCQESNESGESLSTTKVDEYLKYLQSSREIWEVCLDHSPCAREAHDIVRSMLDRLLRARNQGLQNSTGVVSGEPVQLGPNASGEPFSDQYVSNPNYSQAFPDFLGEVYSQDYHRGDFTTTLNLLAPYPNEPSRNMGEMGSALIADQEIMDGSWGGADWPT